MPGELMSAWAAALEGSTFAATVRDSAWAYPLANVGHILGLALLVGPILALDLRLLGVGRGLPVRALSRLLTPLAAIGLLLQIGTGVPLFVADASALVGNPIFMAKVALTLAGIVNALVFRWMWRDALVDGNSDLPALGRVQAALSIVFWLGVAVSGRLIAYF